MIKAFTEPFLSVEQRQEFERNWSRIGRRSKSYVPPVKRFVRPVKATNLVTGMVRHYKSQTDAADCNGISKSAMCRRVSKGGVYGGFIFEYEKVSNYE